MNIKKFQDFVDVLSTKGGNVMLMLIIFIFFLPILIYLMRLSVVFRYDTGEIGTVFISTFSGFAGALLAVLSGNSSKQQMADRVDTLAPSSGKTDINVSKVESVNVAQPVVSTDESKS